MTPTSTYHAPPGPTYLDGDRRALPRTGWMLDNGWHSSFGCRLRIPAPSCSSFCPARRRRTRPGRCLGGGVWPPSQRHYSTFHFARHAGQLRASPPPTVNWLDSWMIIPLQTIPPTVRIFPFAGATCSIVNHNHSISAAPFIYPPWDCMPRYPAPLHYTTPPPFTCPTALPVPRCAAHLCLRTRYHALQRIADAHQLHTLPPATPHGTAYLTPPSPPLP